MTEALILYFLEKFKAVFEDILTNQIIHTN